MTTVAEFTMATADFPLSDLFERLPEITVELERVVPTGNGVVPYLWVSQASPEDAEAVFGSHPALESAQVVDSIDDQHLVRLEWRPDRRRLLDCIADADITLLSATGTASEWTFEVRAADREQIGRFQSQCEELEIPITITSIQTLGSDSSSERYGLTTAQREALAATYEQGYFDEPRRATLEEVARSMGISRQALAARLRRGHRNLIRQTVIRSRPDDT